MKVEFPKVKAYSIVEGHPNWLVPCPYCEKTHVHGAAEGIRSLHCGGHPNAAKTPCILVYAGQAPDDMIARAFHRPRYSKTMRAGMLVAAKAYQRHLAFERSRSKAVTA